MSSKGLFGRLAVFFLIGGIALAVVQKSVIPVLIVVLVVAVLGRFARTLGG